MKTASFSYPLPEAADVLARALELGYKENILDESQLVDGKIPMVQATNEAGDLLFQTEYLSIEDELAGVVPAQILDEEGNPIPLMVQKDISIPNPETPEEYVLEKARELVAGFLVETSAKQALQQAEAEARVIMDAAKAANKATKDTVKNSITANIA